MAKTGTVNYHVQKPERQAFTIDAGGIPGNVLSPELKPTIVQLSDLRNGGVSANFADDGFAYLAAPSNVNNFDDTGAWESPYNCEIIDLLHSEIGARQVETFDHTIRTDDPNSERRPARNVHSDYSRSGAEKRLVDILGPERAAEWSGGHYAFINIWRPIENPINSAPLGFLRPSTVEPDDWVQIDLIYPGRRGYIMGLAANDRHEWVYTSRMKPDEVVYFNIYDNSGRPSVGHSAIDLIEDPSISSIRKSIEGRTVVRF
ncbi:CmcJ/NvfI family oxidoreductase [Amaricoccus macauensis]|uniref:CmcJ/NvfI family oxidoreductase n=1 Tax=Amaricoccus macauensis TaxID=57001 RepID=UPI003C7E413A